MISIRLSIAALALTWLWPAEAARGQDEPPAVIPILLRPATAPVPALKYRLLPERETVVPGNAAVFYHRAVETYLDHLRSAPARNRPGAADDTDDAAASYEWIRGSLEAIPLVRAHRWLSLNYRVLDEIELGTHRASCDWEFDSRTEGYELIISEIQWMRSVANLVALRARIAVVENKPEEAIRWLRTGYAMGRHVAEGPLLIQDVFGVGCCMIMNKPMEDLIQASGTASLYWALAGRPRPFIDLSRALEVERLLPEREVPRLRKLDGLPWSLEEGRAFADDVETKLYQFAGWRASPSAGRAASSERYWLNRFGMAAMVAQAYPESKRALIAAGRSPAQVEAMPAIQVVFIRTYTDYQARRDDLLKWASLPIYQAYDRMHEANITQMTPEIRSRPLLALFCSLVGSSQGAIQAQARLDRQLDAFQCIEAIRLYAASHRRLPDRLEDISEAPVPLDPMTGRPFEYKLEAGRALLSAPTVPPTSQLSSFGLHYELKPAL
jgi:hypothetical protein